MSYMYEYNMTKLI